MLITYEAVVKDNALLAGKLGLDNSEEIKNCLGKNSKTFREIKHQQRETGKKWEEEEEEVGRRRRRRKEEGKEEGGREGGKKGRKKGKRREEGERTESREGRRDGGRGLRGREEGKKVEWQEGRKQKCAKDNETHKTPTPLPDNNFIIIINTSH